MSKIMVKTQNKNEEKQFSECSAVQWDIESACCVVSCNKVADLLVLMEPHGLISI